MISRRRFLRAVSQSAAVAAVGCSGVRPRTAPWAPASPSSSHAIADLALEEARRAGASYADVRVTRSALHRLYLEDRHVELDEGFETSGRGSGFFIRVVSNGAWGFAHGQSPDPDAVRAAVREAIARAAAGAARSGPRVRLAGAGAPRLVRALHGYRDAAHVPRDQKIAALLSVNEALMKTRGVIHADVGVTIDWEWRLVATSDGARLEEETARMSAACTVHAQRGRRLRSRSFTAPPRPGGWETFDPAALRVQCDRLAAEAVEKCSARFFEERRVDLVVMPTHAVLLLHECFGPPTEADRLIGALTKPAAVRFQAADLGSLSCGSPLLNVSGGSAIGRTFDDEGVEIRPFPIVRDGVLVGAQTTRDTALAVSASASASTGSARAVGWASPPLLRSSDLSIAPAPRAGSLDALLADTGSGVIVDGAGTWRPGPGGGIEWKPDAAWAITNGRRAAMLDDVRYVGSAAELFRAMNATSDTAEIGSMRSASKGSPPQHLRHDHRAPALRFSQVRVASGSRSGP